MIGRQPNAAMALSASADDRHSIHAGDHIVLIVEDDAMFASVLLELARERGFKGLIAQDGAGAPPFQLRRVAIRVRAQQGVMA